MNASQDASSCLGIVVVHGVGSPQPAATLSAVCNAIQQANPKIAFTPAVKRLKGDDGHIVSVKDGMAGATTIRAAEAYWGDISMVRSHFWLLAKGLFINLFGLRYICERALVDSPILRKLCAIPFQVVRLVILPLQILAFVLAVPIGLGLWLAPPGNGYLTTYDSMFLALCLAGAVGGLLLSAWWGLRRTGVRSKPWDIALAFALFSTFSMLATDKEVLQAIFGTHDVLSSYSFRSWVESCINRGYGHVPVNPFSLLRDLGQGTVSLEDGLCRVVSGSTPITDSNIQGFGKYVALNEVIGDSAFYLLTTSIVVLIGVATVQMIRGNAEHRKSIILAITVTMIFTVISAILLEPLDLLVRVVQFRSVSNVTIYWYEPLLVVWLALVAAATMAALFHRKWQIFRDKRSGTIQETRYLDRYPRLVVADVLQTAVILATALLMISFIAFDRIPADWYAISLSFTIAGPILLLVIVLLLANSERLRVALNFAMDVINHFVEPARDYPVRQAIARRLRQSIDALTKDSPCSNVLILAHSQGTVITLAEILRGLMTTLTKRGVKTLNIVTFGSPLTHIYQHYFPADYPPGTTAIVAQQLGNNVTWSNIFRVDDPIGTEVSWFAPSWPTNIAMSFGGHVRYWESDVMSCEAIKQALPTW